MINIKGFAVANDGNMKRIAVTYDELDESGKVINPNVKINRLVTDDSIVKLIDKITNYANKIIEE